MILLIIFTLICAFCIWMLFTSVEFGFDSTEEVAFVDLKHILFVGLIVYDEGFYLRVRLFFLQKDFFPLERKSKSDKKSENNKKSKKKKDKKKKKRKVSVKALLRLSVKYLKLIAKQFNLVKFHLEWDTGDFVANAKLFPIANVLNNEKCYTSINFEGRKELIVIFKTKIYRFIVLTIRILFDIRKVFVKQ